ncbi:unnamed protein product [Candida verbasci]|uniref:Mediator of RNA polymerase II transcription subunit 14 n=1 Tax=Candida verbasci TaxID=1227364 RepID=A0A9W4XC19_9ASCO|nr:unnamed protein product [Candida verbasci]
MNGNAQSSSNKDNELLPNIPHITANIIPLSNIIKFYTQDAYKQLVNMIENLSLNLETESDLKRKKYFLELIVDLRSNSIKLYTLCKWSQVSLDVSKFIDLLNYFRLQEFTFDQILFQLQQLNNYGGAKLPNGDIITSIEVLYNKKPTFPSYNYLKSNPISTRKTIEVLKDLNLILVTRFALMSEEQLPSRFEYVIKDGRAYITVKNEFEVSITIGNEVIPEEESDYTKSPFYFIDFRFLFGINPDTNLITYKDDKIFTKLPEKSLSKLEKISNQTLLNSGLPGLYELLHKYTISFKLYLISKQFKDLLINSRWRNNLQINYQMGKSLIILNYWSSFYLGKNWKTFIELGIDSKYQLNYRWFLNGKYERNLELDEIFNPINDTDTKTLNVESILLVVVNKHAELLMSSIYDQLTIHFKDVELINPHQLLLKLTIYKSTIFAVNPLSGHFYFIDPTPTQNLITKKINSPTKGDMIQEIVDNLIQLKLETLVREINYRLFTTEWLSNQLIKLNESEISKSFNLNIKKYTINFYRRKNYPSSWFLITIVNPIDSYTYWYVARVKSILGEWKIQWVQQLQFEENYIPLPKLDFQFFSNLPTICSNMIIDHMIVEELEFKKLKFLKIDKDHQLVKSFESDDFDADLIYESLYIIYNLDLLPIQNSSTSLFLKIRLLKNNQMEVKLFGTFNNSNIKNIKDNFLSIFQKSFVIKDSINLLNSAVYESNKNLLDSIFNRLNHLKKLSIITQQLHNFKISITEYSMVDISILISDINLKIKLFNTSIQLTSENSNFNIQLIIKYLNSYLLENENDSIIGVCKYLSLIQPVLTSIKTSQELINQNKINLSNGLSRLNFDVNFITINYLQFVYNIYSNVPNTKKIQKDKITVSLAFKTNIFNDFRSENFHYLKLSFKDTLNTDSTTSTKFKKLFELIFKSLTEIDRNGDAIRNENERVIKLNFDYLINLNLINEVMNKITKVFISFLNMNNYITTPV